MADSKEQVIIKTS